MATNPDRFCPFPGGRGEPDAASITAAVEACTGVECEAVFGKPERGLLDMIADATGLDPATTVMVGDRLTTDVTFAHNTGMISALVLTGETDRATLDRTPAASCRTSCWSPSTSCSRPPRRGRGVAHERACGRTNRHSAWGHCAAERCGDPVAGGPGRRFAARWDVPLRDLESGPGALAALPRALAGRCRRRVALVTDGRR